MESGGDLWYLCDITQKDEDESNLGDAACRSYESGIIGYRMEIKEREEEKVGKKTIEKNAITEGVIWKQLLIFFSQSCLER